MEVGQCIEVFNPYDWLPGHGENAVEFHAEAGDLSVVIAYDGPNGELKRELLFKRACAFYKTAFPGPGLLDLHCSVSSQVPMGSLIECPDSEAAVAWTRHWNDGRAIKHYSMTFLSENLQLLVFATDCVLKDPISSAS